MPKLTFLMTVKLLCIHRLVVMDNTTVATSTLGFGASPLLSIPENKGARVGEDNRNSKGPRDIVPEEDASIVWAPRSQLGGEER